MCQKCHACDRASDYGVCTLLYNCVIYMKNIQVVLLCGDRSGGKHGDSQKGWFCYVMTGQKGNAGKGEG